MPLKTSSKESNYRVKVAEYYVDMPYPEVYVRGKTLIEYINRIPGK